MEDGGAISLRAILVGALLGIVFAAAMSYVGAKTAFIDGCNIPVSIIAFGVLNVALGRRPTVHDGNVTQTVASSATMMAITGGFMGPLAALWISNEAISIPLAILWGISVGVVGCIIALPLRTIFIENTDLPWPSGTATAEVLRSIYRDAATARRHLRMLAIAAVLAAAFTFVRSFLHWIPESWVLPTTIAGVAAGVVGVGVAWSPMYVALGFLAGPRAGLSLILGGTIAWVVLMPIVLNHGFAQPNFDSMINWVLWPGAGLMLGGTLPGAVNTFRTVRASLRGRSAASLMRTHLVGALVACAAVVGFGSATFEVSPLFPLFGLALAVVTAVAAARANGETDNTPAGPLGGVGQLTVGLTAPNGIRGPLATGGVVNGTLMHSAALLQNWKAGSLTGTPARSIFVGQIVGVVVGAVVCAGAFLLLASTYGIRTEVLPAPAAGSWLGTAKIAEQGIAAMPAYAPLAAAIGFVLGVVLTWKPIAKYAPLPAAMGMAFMLPFYGSLVIGIGGILYWVARRVNASRVDDLGMPIASGVIAGEAVAGLVTAFLDWLGVHV